MDGSSVNTIAVIGAGAMGRGIAYAAALGGYRTILEDISTSMLEAAMRNIEATFADGVTRGKIDSAARDKALSAISTATSVEQACASADLIIEAAPEDIQIKMQLFASFDKITKPRAIFASNTTSLSITEMAAVTSRPERCIGMHFFNPVPKMKLLEMV
ncbi:MAG TPA: 3-hydroxyacyl-CoA dehydrogenase family protein, partial [Candidatus Kapabacteria bacterium]|nr:3-hydroxyacyl-CoA dehydrogenase family protein [Candidatus Kapabacteria bacterium]